MLNCAGYPHSDVQFGGDDLAGLPDLPIVRCEPGVDRRARSTHCSMELVGDRRDVFREVLLALQGATARDDDLCGGELRPVGLDQFLRQEARCPGIWDRLDCFDFSYSPVSPRLEGRVPRS